MKKDKYRHVLFIVLPRVSYALNIFAIQKLEEEEN